MLPLHHHHHHLLLIHILLMLSECTVHGATTSNVELIINHKAPHCFIETTFYFLSPHYKPPSVSVSAFSISILDTHEGVRPDLKNAALVQRRTWSGRLCPLDL